MTNLHIPHSRPWISDQDRQAVLDTLAGNMIAQGEKAKAFENAVKEYVRVEHAIAVASGSSAIVLALAALSLGARDEVVLPTYVCRSVLDAVISVGAKPVICDVDLMGVLNQKVVSNAITRRTKAIIAVHIFGRPCDIVSLRSFGVPVIEDACQAFGLDLGGRGAGTLGDIGVYSFHATKCLTTGEGGMLVCRDPELATRARALAMGAAGQGQRLFMPLSDLQAALGLSQLTRYPEFLNRRNLIRTQYLCAAQEFGLQAEEINASGGMFRFTVFVDQPFGELQNQYSSFGISIRKGVDELLHRIVGLSDDDFPCATELFRKTVSLPFYPSLTDQEVGAIRRSFDLLKNGL
ncbi:DegT/DnrJ/EryC1/StrS aminotransferase family protein [Dechloromonas sp. XY25]|uniref:DegT/DnrJ/EryC1/StrS aminotransferase family protein n=1 Tax=Dechloromonas hankyongensis TaxID=2908002 RepID=A0ABS9JZE5_9RHOO|nr:DegT/DnrJ/EryC1/StrS aminotransferase family protein [Dechloromonas hankyongensis]MCG2576263.1 DegT/DnrJ/EryC1/StrS aminotransferase family protein [Dechloromonas hankyongensis]